MQNLLGHIIIHPQIFRPLWKQTLGHFPVSQPALLQSLRRKNAVQGTFPFGVAINSSLFKGNAFRGQADPKEKGRILTIPGCPVSGPGPYEQLMAVDRRCILI